MGYSLNFWKEAPGVSFLDACIVYERLSDNQHVEGITELSEAEVRLAIESSFNDGWVQESPTIWTHPERGGFELMLTPQLFRVDCYGMGGDDMNRFIDIGALFGCPLYDPQTDQRFTLSSDGT